MDFRKLWCAILILAFADMAPAQGPLVPGLPDRELRYEAIHSMTGNGEAVTVQQPASPSASVQFELAVITCATDCTVALSQNGTGATSTTLATKALNGAPLSTATAWSASNVSGGTSLYTYTIKAALNPTLTLDLTKFFLGKGNGINQNFTITTSGTSNNPSVMIQWVEK